MRNSPGQRSIMPASCADRFLLHRGERLRYRDEGAGPALVLIHGWALDLEMWQPQVAALSDRYRVLRMDRRGFGKSSGAPSLEADADDVRALLEATGVDRVAILGMSQGARAALSLAASAIGCAACLILDGAPADERLIDDDGEVEVPLAHYRRVLRERGIDGLRAEIAQHPFLELRTSDPTARQALADMLARYPARDLGGPVIRPAARAEGHLELRALPVLVLNGEHDTPRRLGIGAALHAAIAGAERAIIPSAGHLAGLDNPGEYNRILVRFLQRYLRRET